MVYWGSLFLSFGLLTLIGRHFPNIDDRTSNKLLITSIVLLAAGLISMMMVNFQ
jgi:hypothetical protein